MVNFRSVAKGERPASSKTVAIIGAGPAGLVAAKEALDNSLFPIIFEKEAELGGVWNPKTGLTWDTLQTNVSKFTTLSGAVHTVVEKAQKDKIKMFPSAEEMYTYLNTYAREFRLRRCIKYNCTVTKILPNPNGAEGQLPGDKGWVVNWKESDGTEKNDIFDGVIIATGILSEPHLPKNIPGLGSIPQGRILHSKEYKSGKAFEGKKVLVVGSSFSGVDIAADVSQYAKSTIHCFRSPFWLLKRYLPDPSRGNKILPVDLVVFKSRKYCLDYMLTLPGTGIQTKQDRVKKTNELLSSLCQSQQEVEELRICKEDKKNWINMVVSDTYLDQVKAGKVIPLRQNVLKIGQSELANGAGSELEVTLGNNQVYQVDDIIMATGFDCSSQPILDEEILETLDYWKEDRVTPFLLFKSTLHPKIANLFFVGMFKNPFAAVIELQARWACRLLSKKINLPCQQVVDKSLEEETNQRSNPPRPQVHYYWDFYTLAYSIAKSSYDTPDFLKLETTEENKLKIKQMIFNQPVIPAHFYLHYDTKEAVDQMESLNELLNKGVEES